MQNNTPLLSVQNVGKAYSGNQVLSDVTMNIMPGEIYAICGENGAGKSTLMNILFGMPVIAETGGFTGKILIDGQDVHIASPLDAIRLGIGMVHQEFLLIPGFTVGENVKLNREPLKPGLFSALPGERMKNVDFEGVNTQTRDVLNRLGIELSETAVVSNLPVGYMQFVEIAKEIDKENTRLLILDEPTAVLTESEAAIVLGIIKRLSKMGIAVMLITHRIDEIMSVADTITILRDGVSVKTMAAFETTAAEIARLMVGRELNISSRTKRETVSEDIVISVRNLEVDMPGEFLNGVSFDLRRGEILGIGGLAGQGKLAIANGVMGLYPAQGEILVESTPLRLNSPKDSIAAHLAFVSEDRRKQGILPDLSIEMNMVVPAMMNHDEFFHKIGFLRQTNKREIERTAQQYIEEFQIRCTGPKQLVGRLSGGNQQKVCITKALLLKPDVLLVSEPTRGIDIGAKGLVLDTIVRINAELGVSVIFTSSELAELRQLCDRIAIISDGRLTGILSPDASDEAFGLAMSGKKVEQ
ncbi:MAG TPA: sugar ABC transporter ATP-binding protein [Clostridia bacterium]|nr:sugar ABC transporter ATP-binding protein [Clostridia bacterium]